MPRRPEDLHEWISFEDPDELRTWVFDATFLLSSWSCIFGQGCQGVLDEPAPELKHGCCSHGAHFIDDADVATVEESAARLTPDVWQFHDEGHAEGWIATTEDGTRITRVHEGACIFANRAGFAGGEGCALHIAATRVGERYIDWKPDVCWQLPLRLVEHIDDEGYVTSTLREWKRRDWGAGGEEFAWWCTESADAFVGARPTYEYLRDEIIEFTGARVYDLLVKQLERRRSKPTPLPHPAVRRRVKD
ncbi:MAG: hypothetical protein R2705_03745 [Ilumatobacteraceae bacterium]